MTELKGRTLVEIDRWCALLPRYLLSVLSFLSCASGFRLVLGQIACEAVQEVQVHRACVIANSKRTMDIEIVESDEAEKRADRGVAAKFYTRDTLGVGSLITWSKLCMKKRR